MTSRDILVVLGTRPEIIKMARVIELLRDRAAIVHTGQHYDDNLAGAFYDELGLRPPMMDLGVGGSSRADQIAEGTRLLAAAIGKIQPSAVVVHGDTNATVAGALAANATATPLIHVEAGLRSYDRSMPEEHNRVVTDHLADLCLAPTETNVSNLATEGIEGTRVVLTGNPIVEAVQRFLPDAATTDAALAEFGLDTPYVLATLHRPENVDRKDVLERIMRSLTDIDAPVLLPLHPRTATRIVEFGLTTVIDHPRLTIVDPLPYQQFLGLARSAQLILSDSGGIQEEASVFKTPVVLVRSSTERPEVAGTVVRRLPPTENIATDLRTCWDDAPTWADEIATLDSPYGTSESPSLVAHAILDHAATIG